MANYSNAEELLAALTSAFEADMAKSKKYVDPSGGNPLMAEAMKDIGSRNPWEEKRKIKEKADKEVKQWLEESDKIAEEKLKAKEREYWANKDKPKESPKPKSFSDYQAEEQAAQDKAKSNYLQSIKDAYSGSGNPLQTDAVGKTLDITSTKGYQPEDYVAKGLIPSSELALQSTGATNAAQKGEAGSQQLQSAYNAVSNFTPDWYGKTKEQLSGPLGTGLAFDYDMSGRAISAHAVSAPTPPQQDESWRGGGRGGGGGGGQELSIFDPDFVKKLNIAKSNQSYLIGLATKASDDLAEAALKGDKNAQEYINRIKSGSYVGGVIGEKAGKLAKTGFATTEKSKEVPFDFTGVGMRTNMPNL